MTLLTKAHDPANIELWGSAMVSRGLGLKSQSQRVLSTFILECTVPILGITIMSWEVSPITVPRTLWEL